MFGRACVQGRERERETKEGERIREQDIHADRERERDIGLRESETDRQTDRKRQGDKQEEMHERVVMFLFPLNSLLNSDCHVFLIRQSVLIHKFLLEQSLPCFCFLLLFLIAVSILYKSMEYDKGPYND